MAKNTVNNASLDVFKKDDGTFYFEIDDDSGDNEAAVPHINKLFKDVLRLLENSFILK